MKLFSKMTAAAMSGALLLLSTPRPAAAKMGFAITPKIWSSVENYNAFDNALVSDSASATQVAVREQINLPLFGVSMILSPSMEVPLDLIFNFYGGSTTGDFLYLVRSATTKGSTISGEYEAERTDVEMLARWRPEDKMVSFVTGLRVNSFEDTLNIQKSVGNWTTPLPTFNASSTTKLQKQTTILLWEVGANFFAPINEAGNHRFFGNATFGVGSFQSKIKNATSVSKQNKKTGGAMAWDINAGYEWMFFPNFGLNMRYRMYAKPTGALKDGYDFTVIHGPDFGLTARF